MDVMERIKKQVEGNPILLYMKGTPDFPQCGFSGKSVQVLGACGVECATVNILEDPEIRANLKHYSQWPTFPQLFINGELIGGSDILIEMYESGELKPLLEAAVAKETAAE